MMKMNGHENQWFGWRQRMKYWIAIVTGMVFWGLAVGAILHASGGFFLHGSLLANLGSSILVSVLYTMAAVTTFKLKPKEGRELTVFFYPVPAFALLACWAVIRMAMGLN
jgi:hypothetical protein